MTPGGPPAGDEQSGAQAAHFAAQLAESEERYGLLFRNNPQPMWVFDSETLMFLAVNEAAVRHYGYTRDEFLAMTVKDIRPPEDLPALLKKTADLPRALIWLGEWRHRKKDGTTIIVDVRGHRLVFDDRAAWLVAVNDITERKRAEVALQESEERLRLALEAAQLGIWEWNIVTGQFTWSGTLARLYGFDPATFDPAFEAFLDRIHPDDREFVRATIERSVAEGTSHDLEFRTVWPDGSVHWIAGKGQVYLDEHGVPTRMLGVDWEITEHKQAEQERARLYEEAQQALHVRDQFLSIAAHELKSPLTALIGYTNLLRQWTPGDPRADQQASRMLEVLADQAERLNALIDRLLDVSRIQQGQFSIERYPMDLGALVARMVDEFRLTLQRHSVTLVPYDAALIVLGDALRLEQVLQNLLANAVKYSPAGGTILVRVERQGQEAVLLIQDQGIGIPAEAQPHLFRPFYRADNAAAFSNGFGIGLYVVHEVVTRHGGRIEVASAPGQGSTFQVYLPLHGEAQG